MQRIRIKLKGYDHKVIEKALSVIIQNAASTGANVVGPIPLPTRKYKFAVMRSRHNQGYSMDHFIQKTHKRLIEIKDINSKTIDAITHLQLPAGVHIEVKPITS